MCGITGFTKSFCCTGDISLIRKMGDCIAHRGPDANGEYLDDYIGLGHRRLSIIDLSDAGNQPMVSSCGRFVIVFNGEIYNFLELRQELVLSGFKLKTQTDTEVLLELYRQYGRSCLDRLNGMFAFAIWDRQDKRLFLARDRIGKKPLYFFHSHGDKLAFASEIKPLLKIPNISPEIDPTSIVDYLKYQYVPAPKTIFRSIHKLPAGHCLELEIGGEPQISSYWDVDFSKSFNGTEFDACEQLLDLLTDSTAIRMIADVPLGSFLSGGIDSSAIVALMCRSSQKKVKTCSIGFDDRRHDETPFAREIAQLYGTDHREYFVRENLSDTVRLLPRFFDEPFADSSAVPTYHVSRLARQDVTVALAGDGGDENFGGYEKYRTELIEDRVRKFVPKPFLQFIQWSTTGLRKEFLRKAATLSQAALSNPALAFYSTNTFISDWELSRLLSCSLQKSCSDYDPSVHTTIHWSKMEGADHVASMLYTDLKTYLPGDILVKVDRMSMAHSLEVRAPILDYRVIEFAASLPSEWKIRGLNKKYVLKQCFGTFLPSHILHRPKHGFTVPLDTWFRNELRELATENLFNDQIMGSYFSIRRLEELWQEHQHGKMNHGTLLWMLLVFSLWHKEYMKG